MTDLAFTAWWDFANGAVDATGNNNNGTLHGTTLTADPFGRPARGFNGSSDYIDGTSSPLGVVVHTNLSPAAGTLALTGAMPALTNSGDVNIDVNAWKTAVLAVGGTVSSGRETLITNLIGGLKLDNVWAKLDRLWLYAAENTQSALIDLVADDAAAAVSSPTFTTDRGFTGNGSTSYINTNFNPATDGVHYTLNSACGGIWDITTSAGSDRLMIGSYNGSVFGIDGTVRYTDGNAYWRINSSAGPSGVYPGPGLFVVNRSGASSDQLYRNGSSIGTSTSGSLSVPSLDIAVLARNTNGAFGFNNTDQVAACVFGGSLTATEQGFLYSRLRTYMTAVGVP